MCGILVALLLSRTNDRTNTFMQLPKEWDRLKEQNSKRGPDTQASHSINIISSHLTITLHFYCTVLHLRGCRVQPQPLIDSTGSILCWNGEIFGGIKILPDENDTRVLLHELERVPVESNISELSILNIFEKIEGPYAVVYFQESTQRLFFGRDCLGRRSLLWHKPQNELDPFVLSSVGVSPVDEEQILHFDEVPANGMYCLDLGMLIRECENPETSLPVGFSFALSHSPWKLPFSSLSSLDPIRRFLTLPFNRINTFLPILPSDLSSPPSLDPNSETGQATQRFLEVLSESVRLRVVDIPYHEAHSSANSPRLAILFSGGLDCAVIAALADIHLTPDEPIDLLNVAFENPRSLNAKRRRGEHVNIYDVPDRLTGRSAVAELRKIAPNRHWNFVEIDVPFMEAKDRESDVTAVMEPNGTVMDLSIALAFWFAARGKGQIASPSAPTERKAYQSTARVLLSGLGADEQLGGYSRHTEAFRRGGWEALIQETQLDIDRISTRNLGRDDRTISAHGKEVRFPYLSTRVVSFLCSLPIHHKMDLRLPRGVGEKLLLRNVARALGFDATSRNPKRAVQFGAKTAKMIDTKERGGDLAGIGDTE